MRIPSKHSAALELWAHKADNVTIPPCSPTSTGHVRRPSRSDLEETISGARDSAARSMLSNDLLEVISVTRMAGPHIRKLSPPWLGPDNALGPVAYSPRNLEKLFWVAESVNIHYLRSLIEHPKSAIERGVHKMGFSGFISILATSHFASSPTRIAGQIHTSL